MMLLVFWRLWSWIVAEQVGGVQEKSSALTGWHSWPGCLAV